MIDKKKGQKSKKIFADGDVPENDIESKIKTACRGLMFISETDAEVLPLIAKRPRGDSLTDYAAALNLKTDEIEERGFDEFFVRLTSEKDWHGPHEKRRIKDWSKLRDVLERGLKGIRVIRVGRIRLDIYIVGVDAGGRLAGVRTKAIET